jgi:hypothetical protein
MLRTSRPRASASLVHGIHELPERLPKLSCIYIFTCVYVICMNRYVNIDCECIGVSVYKLCIYRLYVLRHVYMNTNATHTYQCGRPLGT